MNAPHRLRFLRASDNGWVASGRMVDQAPLVNDTLWDGANQSAPNLASCRGSRRRLRWCSITRYRRPGSNAGCAKNTLDGLRLGILDNSKWNANKLRRGASAALGKTIKFAAVNYYVKHSFAKDAAPELIEQIVRENDIVLTAIGDCGSCPY